MSSLRIQSHEPELLVRADQIPDDELFGAHMVAQRKLFQIVHERTGMSLNPEVFTLELKEPNARLARKFVVAGWCSPAVVGK